MYSVFLSSYTNTRESLGELEKAVETLACGWCSHKHFLHHFFVPINNFVAYIVTPHCGQGPCVKLRFHCAEIKTMRVVFLAMILNTTRCLLSNQGHDSQSTVKLIKDNSEFRL